MPIPVPVSGSSGRGGWMAPFRYAEGKNLTLVTSTIAAVMVLVAVLFMAGVPAAADPADLFHRERLAGDLGGLRSDLAGRGLERLQGGLHRAALPGGSN